MDYCRISPGAANLLYNESLATLKDFAEFIGAVMENENITGIWC